MLLKLTTQSLLSEIYEVLLYAYKEPVWTLTRYILETSIISHKESSL